MAVYNGHWPTLGGGEQVAGALAVALAQRDDVDLLVTEHFDAVRASERLGFDLSGLPQVEIGPGTRRFLEATERYDLVVNTSYANTFASRAPRNLYYVHFPVPDPRQTRAERLAWELVTPNPLRSWIEWTDGFWVPEFRALGVWTKAAASLDLVIPRDLQLPFGLTLSAGPWPAGRRPHVRVTVDGRDVFDGPVGHQAVKVRTTVTGAGVDRPLAVTITSDTFVPRLEHGSADDRELGVVVSHVHLGRRGPVAPRRAGSSLAAVPSPVPMQFLASYQEVVANSAYTATWIERRWGREADVLCPPVQPRAAGAKGPAILSVGRFFPSASGHSKKQLELVEAFRRALASGLDGWELHLVGGCAPTERAYVEDVRRAAVGLPVHFYVNARGDDLDALFAKASLFWHAAGLGEDAERHPERLEHFGIGVVEAMSAGAVPVVYARGGPAAVVTEGACGRLFSDVAELADRTLELAAEPAERARLAARAQEAAAGYTFDRFAAHLADLVDRVEARR